MCIRVCNICSRLYSLLIVKWLIGQNFGWSSLQAQKGPGQVCNMFHEFHVVKKTETRSKPKNNSMVIFKKSIVLAIPVFSWPKEMKSPSKKRFVEQWHQNFNRNGFFVVGCWLFLFCTLVKLALITCEQRKHGTAVTKPRTRYKFNPLQNFLRGKFA